MISTGRVGARPVLCALLLVLGGTAALCAQAGLPHPPPHVIRWWEGAAVFGGIALVSTLDEPVQHTTQAARSPTTNELASVARRMGQPEVFVTVPVALFVTGMATHRPALRRSAARVVGSLALAGALAVAGKYALGRLRPSQTAEPGDWKPFSGADAFPSGHATMAFALATSLADEIRRPWATVGLLTAAAGTGWSRLNDDKHWLSDVMAGAAVGIGAAQMMEGRWTVFHLRPPALLVTPRRLGLAWRIVVRAP
jgi:membrane-associated phospholipid phosphatase